MPQPAFWQRVRPSMPSCSVLIEGELSSELPPDCELRPRSIERTGWKAVLVRPGIRGRGCFSQINVRSSLRVEWPNSDRIVARPRKGAGGPPPGGGSTDAGRAAHVLVREV